MMKYAPSSQTLSQHSVSSSTSSSHDQTQIHDTSIPLASSDSEGKPHDSSGNIPSALVSLGDSNMKQLDMSGNRSEPRSNPALPGTSAKAQSNNIANSTQPSQTTESTRSKEWILKPFPFQSNGPGASSPEWINDEPRDRDVLLGRGGRSNAHPGNKIFRSLVVENKPKYRTAQSNKEKQAIVRSIVDSICSVPEDSPAGTLPGRFITLDGVAQRWYDVGETHARNKTAQALREEKAAPAASKHSVDSMGVWNNHKPEPKQKMSTSYISENTRSSARIAGASEHSIPGSGISRPGKSEEKASLSSNADRMAHGVVAYQDPAVEGRAAAAPGSYHYTNHLAPLPPKIQSTSGSSAGSHSPSKLNKEARTVTFSNESSIGGRPQMSLPYIPSSTGLDARTSSAPAQSRPAETKVSGQKRSVDGRLITEEYGGSFHPHHHYPYHHPGVYIAGGTVGLSSAVPLYPPPTMGYHYPGMTGPPPFPHPHSQYHDFSHSGASSKVERPSSKSEKVPSVAKVPAIGGDAPKERGKEQVVTTTPRRQRNAQTLTVAEKAGSKPCLSGTCAPAILKINPRSKLRRSYSDTFVDDFNLLKKESFLKSWKELKEMSSAPNFSVLPRYSKTVSKESSDSCDSTRSRTSSPTALKPASQSKEPLTAHAKSISSFGNPSDAGGNASTASRKEEDLRFDSARTTVGITTSSGLSSNEAMPPVGTEARLPQCNPLGSGHQFSAEEYQEAMERFHKKEIEAAAAGKSLPAPPSEEKFLRPGQYLRYMDNGGHDPHDIHGRPDAIRRSVTEASSSRRSPILPPITVSRNNQCPTPPKEDVKVDDDDSTGTELILASIASASEVKEDENISETGVANVSCNTERSRTIKGANGKKHTLSRKRSSPSRMHLPNSANPASIGDDTFEKSSKKAKEDHDGSIVPLRPPNNATVNGNIASSRQNAHLNNQAPLATLIKQPSELDILFGRGGRTNHHPGNKHFRYLVEEHRQRYRQLQGNKRKQKIAQEIVDQIYSSGGRFLRMSSTPGVWEDVGKKAARGKTSQALREAATSLTPLVQKKDDKISTEGDTTKSAHSTDHMESNLVPDDGMRSSGNSPPPLSLALADRHTTEDHKDVGMLLLGLKASHSQKPNNADV